MRLVLQGRLNRIFPVALDSTATMPIQFRDRVIPQRNYIPDISQKHSLYFLNAVLKFIQNVSYDLMPFFLSNFDREQVLEITT